MPTPEEINADMLAFWNGNGGHTWVARQEHTDITLAPVKVEAGPLDGVRQAGAAQDLLLHRHKSPLFRDP